jgi:uncharacterized lipoprotein
MLRMTILLVAAILGGCAFTPQAVTIAPTVSVSASQVGKDRDVAVNVLDERPKNTLGTVGASGIGADISIKGDLAASVQNALREGLTKLNFRPSANRGSAASELRVEIRNLDYTIIVGFWAGTLRVDVGLKAICVRGVNRPYEKLHRGEFVESVQVVQQSEANNRYVNAAVSSAVNALLADKELMDCLAQ